ncbi:non-canonical purine NTP pyrophosphatase [Rubrobacter xylanophilus]|uniref:Non-canonical purine NTP pyrophosphatase n=2 Tax=Rubrobacter xylanophilus TaxID=49319 RepID=A0A510HI84_9ACTN|nr:non-canonical purine NTP pyrophosphatase [Rubrobacter xylanophilus]
MRPMRPIFVTGNENKLREAERILGVSLERADPGVPEIQSPDLGEVARAKALAAREALGRPPRPVVVEDSGLVIEAWGGLPGAFTRWFLAGVGNEGILRMLSAFEGRSARAICVVAIADASGEVRTFRSEVSGSIAPEPRGSGGFGWDPIFVPEGSRLTYAEMGEEKHRSSHRARAFRAAAGWLRKET